jgi:hypothetical protein
MKDVLSTEHLLTLYTLASTATVQNSLRCRRGFKLCPRPGRSLHTLEVGKSEG